MHIWHFEAPFVMRGRRGGAGDISCSLNVIHYGRGALERVQRALPVCATTHLSPCPPLFRSLPPSFLLGVKWQECFPFTLRPPRYPCLLSSDKTNLHHLPFPLSCLSLLFKLCFRGRIAVIFTGLFSQKCSKRDLWYLLPHRILASLTDFKFDLFELQLLWETANGLVES